MHHFVYRNGVLHAEAVNLADLAQAVATPFYCYSTATLRRHYEVFADAFADVKTLICYAMKANSNQAVIKTLAALGAGADVVSEGELKRARAAGIAPDKIMFSGIGKTAAELALAVDEGILCVNVESEAELELLSSIAKGKGRTARISVRVNPNVPYREDNEPPPHPEAYAAMVKRATRDLDCTLIFEPGRLIVGNAGILVTRVLYLKRGETKTFVIVDAGMNDLLRPTLYEAHHDIRAVREPRADAVRIIADVAGPVCESGDFLALEREMVAPRPGDLLAVMTAGAYGAVQAGTYNTRALVPEVLVRENEWALVRPRLEVSDLIALDRLPPWL